MAALRHANHHKDQTLTDEKDADYPALQPAYVLVTLTNLDGSGYLRGEWANISNNTGPAARSSDNTFLFLHDQHAPLPAPGGPGHALP